MNFFANGLTDTYLRNVLPGEEVEIEWVKAAIAYGNDEETLLKNCLDGRRRLDVWMRYDHTVPVSPALLRSLLRSSSRNVFCRLVPDALHAKVIWWRGYGVYIGSANLTDRAWMTNIEFGVFLSESELEASGSLGAIELFFDELDSCDAAFDLTEEIIIEQEAILKARAASDGKADSVARSMRSVNFWSGPAFIANKKSAIDRQKTAFIKEWQGGAVILRDIADRAPSYKPAWLNADVPPSWQADQFLHAYYYNRVVDGVSHPYEEFFQRNFRDPIAATVDALQWWAALPTPPSDEDVNCHERAPLVRRILAEDRIKKMSQEDLRDLFSANHSSWDHIRRMTYEQLRIDPIAEQSVDRVEAFSRLIWSQRNAEDQSVADLIGFVLDGGRSEEMASRLFDASGVLGFPHLGKNQLAEMAGWARPEKFSPRNGRTSKALRALGYNVKIY
jgi:hypothetical protein